MTKDDIKALYRKCYPKVADYITRNSGTEADAEDAFQQALLGLLRRSPDLDPIAEPADYLFIASKNNFVRAHKRNSKQQPNDEPDAEPTEDEGAAEIEGTPEVDEQEEPTGTSSAAAFGETVDPAPLPDELLYLAMRREATLAALNDLSLGERKLIELSFNDHTELSTTEIAELLGIQPEAVPVKRARAVKKLGDLMEQRGYPRPNRSNN